jgi:hypothetical protein
MHNFHFQFPFSLQEFDVYTLALNDEKLSWAY